MTNESFAKCVVLIADGNIKAALDMLLTAGVPLARAEHAISLLGAV